MTQSRCDHCGRETEGTVEEDFSAWNNESAAVTCERCDSCICVGCAADSSTGLESDSELWLCPACGNEQEI